MIMQGFSAAAVAVLALAVALTVMWRHRWQGSRLTVLLMLLAGFGLTSMGWFGDMLTRAGTWAGGAADAGTGRLFGVGVPLIVIAVMLTWLVVDMRDRAIHPATPWIALALPTVLAVVGGVYVGIGDTVLGFIGTGLSSLAGWLSSIG
jgi:hypothetical protein